MNILENIWKRLIDYLSNEELWVSMGQGFLKIILIIALSILLIKIGKIAVHKVFNFRSRSPLRISERRENTLVRLLENVLTYIIYFVALMMVLETFTIDVKALIAGAGIVGLAVGFGAQSLVKDVITGFFIIFEDQFSVGDYVRVGQFEGHVEEIGLRTTKIKNWTGELHIIPNGNIMEVTNFSIHNSIAFVDVSVAYEGDISESERVIQELLEELPSKYEEMLTTPELLGVQMLGASEVTLRVVCEVEPMAHFGVARILRKEIKQRLDQHGIEIPFPRIVMYNRSENQVAEKGREA
ncbi:mechanosensitive ion channel family protein [Metabacillus arenae]|uniref:Mechanosensitive ion channel family protein n=1 Tax=Metabacillus arenae TaxID=2771434 RepID=A0A926S0B8_9BACI|nr:mechanosensitive ion channel family protein [Metabacillus arenae]MBD1379849.1 mechanosensitive ion channel family protein [Metabacillus arenae]